VHRALENRLILGITTLINTEGKWLATFNCKGNNLVLKRVVPELGGKVFSEVLQNQDTS
jgi:hypothetical protein